MTCKFNNYVDLKVTFEEYTRGISLVTSEGYYFELNYQYFYCSYAWGQLHLYTPCIKFEEYETIEFWDKWIKEL